MNYFKSLKWEMIFYSVICIIMGVLMALHPDTILNTVCYILAIALLLVGVRYLLEYKKNDNISSFYKYELVLGIIFVVAAIFVIVKKDFIISIIPFVVGIIIVISGIMKIENAVDLKKMGSYWIPLMVLAIINILLGLFILGNPQETASFVIRVAGIVLIYSGIVDLLTTLTVSGKIKRFVSERKIIDVEANEVEDDNN